MVFEWADHAGHPVLKFAGVASLGDHTFTNLIYLFGV